MRLEPEKAAWMALWSLNYLECQVQKSWVLNEDGGWRLRNQKPVHQPDSSILCVWFRLLWRKVMYIVNSCLANPDNKSVSYSTICNTNLLWASWGVDNWYTNGKVLKSGEPWEQRLLCVYTNTGVLLYIVYGQWYEARCECIFLVLTSPQYIVKWVKYRVQIADS